MYTSVNKTCYCICGNIANKEHNVNEGEVVLGESRVLKCEVFFKAWNNTHRSPTLFAVIISLFPFFALSITAHNAVWKVFWIFKLPWKVTLS